MRKALDVYHGNHYHLKISLKLIKQQNDSRFDSRQVEICVFTQDTRLNHVVSNAFVML